jgi:hypothetical protein
VGNFLTTCKPVSFSSRTVLHAVRVKTDHREKSDGILGRITQRKNEKKLPYEE